MFLRERGYDVATGQRPAPAELYADYCRWHENKGLWPNETPLGELIEKEN